MFNNIYRGKKVLITGHTGFKGSWLAVWLGKLGADVVGIALPPDTSPSHFSALKLQQNIDSHFVDIRGYNDLSKILCKTKPEVIFHLAAQPLVRDSYDKPLYTLETNIMGTANLLNACRPIDSLRAVIVVTSDKCYDNKEWAWGYRETDAMGGYDPYSMSKGCAELVTASFRNSYFNLDHFGKEHQVLIASARAGNVIGGGDWARDRLVPDIVRGIIANEKIAIRNPNATRPWQHVLECLSGYLALGAKLIEGEKQFADAWNFAPNIEEEAKVIDVVTNMQKCWPKFQYEIKQLNNQPHEAHLLKLDSSKAMALLKWRNVWGFAKTVDTTINWYRNFYDNAAVGNKVATEQDIEDYINAARALNIEWTIE